MQSSYSGSPRQAFEMSTGLIPRALASIYPYQPDYVPLARHPSMKHRLFIKRRVFDLPAATDAGGLKEAVSNIKRDASLHLVQQTVKHFEIVFEDGLGEVKSKYGWQAVIDKENK